MRGKCERWEDVEGGCERWEGVECGERRSRYVVVGCILKGFPLTQ